MKSAIYTRVSSKEQVDKYSLPAQEKILKECIAKEGHEFVGMYTDAGISGERIVNRPEFQRLLMDADEKKFQAVWVVDQDRLSRGDLADLAYIKKVFKENNIQLCTPYQKRGCADRRILFRANITFQDSVLRDLLDRGQNSGYTLNDN